MSPRELTPKVRHSDISRYNTIASLMWAAMACDGLLAHLGEQEVDLWQEEATQCSRCTQCDSNDYAAGLVDFS